MDREFLPSLSQTIVWSRNIVANARLRCCSDSKIETRKRYRNSVPDVKVENDLNKGLEKSRWKVVSREDGVEHVRGERHAVM